MMAGRPPTDKDLRELELLIRRSASKVVELH